MDGQSVGQHDNIQYPSDRSAFLGSMASGLIRVGSVWRFPCAAAVDRFDGADRLMTGQTTDWTGQHGSDYRGRSTEAIAAAEVI
jgi:hypothetical protein